ncbi:MAG: hypothetical protein KGH75_02680 [Rhodospirillales bacterium]|nr:hypothetical protein [Rhodospirillales bacterium]
MISVSLTDTDVFTAIRSALLVILPAGTEVIRTLANGVPMPIGGFVAMNPVGMKRMNVGVTGFADPGTNPGTKTIETDVQFDVQLDFYGESACAWATMTQALFRDESGVSLFPSTVVPLYADDPQQMPLINGEQQFETRWRVQAAVQFNPATTVSQDFAGALTVTPAGVDAAFKP